MDANQKDILSPPVTAFVDVISPGISLDKTAQASNIESGETAVYNYEVRNTGDDPADLMVNFLRELLDRKSVV